MRRAERDIKRDFTDLHDNVTLRRAFLADIDSKGYRPLFKGRVVDRIEDFEYVKYQQVYSYRTLLVWSRNQRKKDVVKVLGGLGAQSWKDHVTEEEREFLRKKVEEIREFYSRENFNNRTREYINNLNIIEW